jgi:hypothetical protein
MARSLAQREDWPRDAVDVRRFGGDPLSHDRTTANSLRPDGVGLEQVDRSKPQVPTRGTVRMSHILAAMTVYRPGSREGFA